MIILLYNVFLIRIVLSSLISVLIFTLFVPFKFLVGATLVFRTKDQTSSFFHLKYLTDCKFIDVNFRKCAIAPIANQTPKKRVYVYDMENLVYQWALLYPTERTKGGSHNALAQDLLERERVMITVVFAFELEANQ